MQGITASENDVLFGQRQRGKRKRRLHNLDRNDPKINPISPYLSGDALSTEEKAKIVARRKKWRIFSTAVPIALLLLIFIQWVILDR